MSDKPGRPRSATIKDVAREAGVSYSTVSRVLNDYRHVHPDKRRRVLDAMERLGYTVNLQARSLAGGRSQMVGLVVHDLGNPYTAQIVQSIDEELATAGYELALHTTHGHHHKEAVYVDLLTHGLADGVLMLIPLGPTPYLRQLRDRNYPYVILSDHQQHDGYSPVVTTTSRQGAVDVMQCLIELGHRRIGFIGGRHDFVSAAERLDAYRAALAACNLSFDPALVQAGDYQYRSGYAAATALLDLPQPPTAIFAANDLMAFAVYDVARSRGIRIPKDLSVVGFDDVPQASYMHPPLTTVRQPLIEMGRTAARLLLQAIENPAQPADMVVLPTELVIRDSCQPPAHFSRRFPSTTAETKGV
ncbi:MAG: LacI family DNA-binding transcriptional regulator [Chloroflexi bacterium]|nr:LacI family DNA-binding transcriptional regulator [Chloroflexota bacterium]